MNTHAEKMQDNEGQANVNRITALPPIGEPAHSRPSTHAQRQLQELVVSSARIGQLKAFQSMASASAQTQPVVQRLLDQEEVDEWVDRPEEEWDWMSPEEKAQIGKIKRERQTNQQRQAEWNIVLASRVWGMRAVSWTYGASHYHISMGPETYHVTEETSPKTHYFFEGTGTDIKDKQPKKEERSSLAGTVQVFSALPADIQAFVKANFDALLL